jgi:O-antigen/teichoic acid export membrane protein
VLALRGGADLVALWAQVASAIEVVSGVALAGLGTGLSVYVARTSSLERQRELLREALKIGLLVALPVALVVAASAEPFARYLGGEKVAPAVVVLGATVGWVAVIPGLIGSLWLGQQRRDRMLALALGQAVLTVAVAWLAPRAQVLALIAAAQAAPAAIVLFIGQPADEAGRFRSRSHPLRRYVLPSVAIGFLSPASTLVVRGVVGDALSWHEAGVLQALWRVSDWVCGFAGGVLSVYYLPQFAAARERDRFLAMLRTAAVSIMLPSALVLAIFWLLRGPVLSALYDESFEASGLTVALIFAGSVVRIGAWVAMFGLYALRRTRALAIGDFLSLPLFAALALAAGHGLTLELAGAFWLLAFCAYLAFNVAALRR